MPSQNLLQQIKNSHSLLQASLDKGWQEFQETETFAIFLIFVIFVGAKHWSRQYLNHTQNVY